MATLIQRSTTGAPDSIIEDAIYSVVRIRSLWQGYWFNVDGLFAENVVYACSPDMPRATLIYHYGDVKPIDRTEFGAYEFEEPAPPFFPVPLFQPATFVPGQLRPSLDIVRYYVKIELWTDILIVDPLTGVDHKTAMHIDSWYGVVEEEDVSRADRESGVQRFTCYGLEMLLEREQITKSYVAAHDHNSVIEVQRPIQFNLGHSRTVEGAWFTRGNMADTASNRGGPVSGSEGGPVFCGQFGLEQGLSAEFEQLQAKSTSKAWAAGDIAHYLLTWFPERRARDPGQQWKLVAFSDLRIGRPGVEFKPVVRTEGRTVKSVLDEIFSRQRMLSWKIMVDSDTNHIQVCWFPLVADAVQFAGNIVLGGALIGKDLILRAPLFGQVQAQIRRSDLHRYDRVVCRGGRMGITFTIDKLIEPKASFVKRSAAHTMEYSWSAEEQIDYEKGGLAEELFAAADTSDRQRINARVRSSAKLVKVFSWYRIPDESFGFGDLEALVKADLVTPDAAARDMARFGFQWRPGLRLSRQLPLLEGVDYSGDKIKDRKWIHTAAVQAIPTPMPPKLFLKEVDIPGYTLAGHEHTWIDASSPERGHIMSQFAYGGQLADIRVAVHPLEGDYGVALDVQNNQAGAGGGRHALHKTLFTNRQDPEEVDADAVYDLKDEHFALTVHAETDSYCDASAPGNSSRKREALERELVIDMGDEYRLEAVEWGTVLGVNGDGTRQTTNGGWLHDDRAKLQEIANLAYAWYKRPRYAITVEAKFPQFLNFAIGDVVRNVKDERGEAAIANAGPSPAAEQCSVNSVVTQISINLINGTAEMRTDFANLDVRLLR